MEEVVIKEAGDTYTSTEFNNLPLNELQNMINNTGLTFDGNDLTQLSQAVNILAANSLFYNSQGMANVYNLTAYGSTEISEYFNGLTVIFLPQNDNTGASTINVNGIGDLALLTEEGLPLSGGELSTSLLTRAVHLNGAFYLEPVLSSDINLKTELANQNVGLEGNRKVGHSNASVYSVSCRAYLNWSANDLISGSILNSININRVVISGGTFLRTLTVYFNEPMSTTNYVVICTPRAITTSQPPTVARYSNLTQNSVTITLSQLTGGVTIRNINSSFNLKIYEAR